MTQLSIKSFFSKLHLQPQNSLCEDVENTTKLKAEKHVLACSAKENFKKSSEPIYCKVKTNDKKSVNLMYVSTTPTPPASPHQPMHTEVSSRWKKILEEYDSYTSPSSSKSKEVVKTPRQKKQNDAKAKTPTWSDLRRQVDKKMQRKIKKCKLLENPPKVEIDIEAISVTNFTEQLLALELIKEYLNEE